MDMSPAHAGIEDLEPQFLPLIEGVPCACRGRRNAATIDPYRITLALRMQGYKGEQHPFPAAGGVSPAHAGVEGGKWYLRWNA